VKCHWNLPEQPFHYLKIFVFLGGNITVNYMHSPNTKLFFCQLILKCPTNFSNRTQLRGDPNFQKAQKAIGMDATKLAHINDLYGNIVIKLFFNAKFSRNYFFEMPKYKEITMERGKKKLKS
jgi:hypothetical protein